MLTILFAGLPILAIGAIDDLRGLQALPKLSVEIAVSLGLWWAGLRVEPTLLWGLQAGEAGWLASPLFQQGLSCLLTLAWLVGVMNATNLIDGLDGLASGVALFALSTTAVAAVVRGDLLLALIACALAGAVGGFFTIASPPRSSSAMPAACFWDICWRRRRSGRCARRRRRYCSSDRRWPWACRCSTPR